MNCSRKTAGIAGDLRQKNGRCSSKKLVSRRYEEKNKQPDYTHTHKDKNTKHTNTKTPSFIFLYDPQPGGMRGYKHVTYTIKTSTWQAIQIKNYEKFGIHNSKGNTRRLLVCKLLVIRTYRFNSHLVIYIHISK